MLKACAFSLPLKLLEVLALVC